MSPKSIVRLCAGLLLVSFVAAPSPAEAQRRGRGQAATDALLDLAGSSEQVLLPSQIDRRLRHLDESNPFVELDVRYPVTGVRSYDRFFENLARVQGTLALAQYVIDHADTTVDDTLVAQVFSGDIFVDAFGRAIEVPPERRQEMVVALIRGDARAAGQIVRNMSSITFRQVRENFVATFGDVGGLVDIAPVLVSELAELPALVAELATQTPDLATEAPSTFAGANAVHAPRVAAALARAGQDLAQVPDRVVALGQGLSALTTTAR